MDGFILCLVVLSLFHPVHVWRQSASYVDNLNEIAELKARHYKPRPSTYTIVHGQNVLFPRPEPGEDSDL